MSIRQLSLKELRALAQQRLGTRAAELKTRQELIDGIEKAERKAVPRRMVPLAAPLPVPVPAPPAPQQEKELPPAPVIWTGAAPMPQITARPADGFRPAPEVPEGRAVEENMSSPSRPRPARPAAEVPALPPVAGVPLPPVTREQPPLTPLRTGSARDERGVPSGEMASEAETITQHFFHQPAQPRLPVTYEDDRVLTFSRDPRALFVAWDFSVTRFEPGPALGQVVNEAGAVLQSFPIAGPAGGAFLEQLPPSGAVKIEVRQETRLVGESGWVQLGAPPAAPEPQIETAAPTATPAPSEEEAPAARVNAPSSVV